MAIRMLTAAAVFVALAAPVLAETSTTKSSTSCWRGTCTTETKTEIPDPPRKNQGYLPNFSGMAGGASVARSETLVFPAAEPRPVDPKCRAVNACLKIYPGREGDHGTVSFRSGNP